jgi:hypothetical protein
LSLLQFGPPVLTFHIMPAPSGLKKQLFDCVPFIFEAPAAIYCIVSGLLTEYFEEIVVFFFALCEILGSFTDEDTCWVLCVDCSGLILCCGIPLTHTITRSQNTEMKHFSFDVN